MTNSSGPNLVSRKAGTAGADARDGVRSSRRTMWMVVVLGLISIAGLVGMLVADAMLDTLFFLLTALPLAFGVWRLKLPATHAARRASDTDDE